MMVENEIPKHRKHRGKRRWKVKFEYVGDTTDQHPIQKLIRSNVEHKYHSEKSARQALNDWENGVGSWPPHNGEWKGRVEEC